MLEQDYSKNPRAVDCMDQARKNIWVKSARIAAKTILFIILFFLVILLLVQTGPIQNLLRVKAVAYLEKKLQTKYWVI